VRRGLDHATDPTSPDALNFTRGGQPLVDAAFLAYGLILAPETLWRPLPADVKTRVLTALRATRQIEAGLSNWLLFPAMIEAFLAGGWHGMAAGTDRSGALRPRIMVQGRRRVRRRE